ncbi:glycine zipper 2TM domain-containing protein [Microbulbifer thermotolerans]|uniref:Glycine zipper 2TM domain-containing protein n=1 Tax=Microbulbifer thermotolerans TaxID=252514 RepID=A0A143HKX5_MICTH|nr:glycine zipper 2TM domain-containing protein [Microbulbifer thermotolerans]AMX02167.1 hypothetical protein A3224_05840 [Microbulbifer thermotolerans]MCX2778867.1 glycine zipper 2TM domain-containing protein [Microbulbifer thermotolerans]MCX2784323.1 glycine zipper 2TM domain-containing protein [Microbulbifer thermotolerans]MCX2793753.1 glycine zipper 2TM domain-containing protein [Microbulbifer thermotolerans]MCX2800936.1 glycine zipper 2TM domain-containing protein [Microbulbifer thermotol
MKYYKQLLVAALVAGLVGFSACASAGDSGYYPHDGYDYARVVSATPVYTDVQVQTPRTQCWDEQVAYRQPASPAGAVIGGLIGAAVGNKLGKNRHRGHGYRHRHDRGASTVAGAAVGALVGHQISSANAPTHYVTEQRCQVVEEVTTRRELIGYDVRYRYNGREYLTRTDRHPGDRIRVRVDVTPAW